MSESAGRYAIYFAAVPGSALAQFGAGWLGRDPATGALQAQPHLAGVTPQRLYEITAEPRRYGFHATLKPPFVPASGADVAAVDQAIAALASSRAAFAAPSLRLSSIAGFWALTLSQPCPEMVDLAAACVSELDRFRAPPGIVELQRRRRAGLSPRQDALLQRWGYPYVMEEFRFHMTLTARLPSDEGETVRQALAPLVEPLCRSPLPIDAISLFHQPSREAPFCVVQRYPLAGARPASSSRRPTSTAAAVAIQLSRSSTP